MTSSSEMIAPIEPTASRPYRLLSNELLRPQRILEKPLPQKWSPKLLRGTSRINPLSHVGQPDPAVPTKQKTPG